MWRLTLILWRRFALGALAMFLAGACSSVTPLPIRTGDACFRCKRPIADIRLAAQAIGGGLASNFRTAGCLAKYLADHPDEKNIVFVSDYAGGKMVLAESAVYVPTLNRDNGERDYMAFKDRAAANAEAVARQTSPVTWADVLAQAKKDQRGN
ncbi:MAG: hypothetical protein HY048_10710 [Acidobacteria bacterium]|nr:hypothetical protein [Acidobacteriota bacterium]